MQGGIEAAGDIATGGLIAHAVDLGVADDGRAGAHGGQCLNCAMPLAGEFCHACGQSAHVHRTLGSIGHDLLHGVFHFEGKVWRTIPMLVRHPGRLTRCYIDGHRARYVSPLALFLFAVFVMAAAFNWVGGHGRSAQTPQQRAEALRVTDERIAAVQVQQRELAAEPAGDPPVARRITAAALASSLRSLQSQRAALASGREVANNALEAVHTDVAPIDDFVRRIRENPQLLAYKVQSSSYKLSWALIPISTPFVALLFLWRRRFPMYDHAIFVIYSLSFVTLLIAVLRLLTVAGFRGQWGMLVVAVALPVHMFAQLRGTYALSRFGAAWRTFVLLNFASFALLLFSSAILLMEIYD